jgi:PAH dioxygenase small subunit
MVAPPHRDREGIAAMWIPMPAAAVGSSVPFASDPAYAEGVAWLVHEANILNQGKLEDWLKLLSPRLRYVMPAISTHDVFAPGTPAVNTGNAIYDESYESIKVRIKRLQAVTQWAENPPSRSRRFVANIELLTAADDGIRLLSSVLLLRSRGASSKLDMVSVERVDQLVPADSGPGLLLAERTINVDQETLAVANLTSFL